MLTRSVGRGPHAGALHAGALHARARPDLSPGTQTMCCRRRACRLRCGEEGAGLHSVLTRPPGNLRSSHSTHITGCLRHGRSGQSGPFTLHQP